MVFLNNTKRQRRTKNSFIGVIITLHNVMWTQVHRTKEHKRLHNSLLGSEPWACQFSLLSYPYTRGFCHLYNHISLFSFFQRSVKTNTVKKNGMQPFSLALEMQYINWRKFKKTPSMIKDKKGNPCKEKENCIVPSFHYLLPLKGQKMT